MAPGRDDGDCSWIKGKGKTPPAKVTTPVGCSAAALNVDRVGKGRNGEEAQIESSGVEEKKVSRHRNRGWQKPPPFRVGLAKQIESGERQGENWGRAEKRKGRVAVLGTVLSAKGKGAEDQRTCPFQKILPAWEELLKVAILRKKKMINQRSGS